MLIDLTYPLADSSRVLHRPSSLSIPEKENKEDFCGLKIALTPATIPSSCFRDLKSVTLRCMDTLEDEHAVSIATDDPVKLNRNDTLPGAALLAQPDAKYPSIDPNKIWSSLSLKF